MRNLTKTLAVFSILAPASAHPLGIGDIKLHSALNQNLNAEIGLVLSGEKPSDIRVNLAPPDKFNEAGVPWSYFLSKIRFETLVKPNGSVIIKLTSNEALKEPFLDLLLEVSWPKGNLYREFTVLVDPPAVYKQATIPVLTSPERYPPNEQQDQFTPYQRPATTRKTQTHFTRDGEYGPTRKKDTLWKVAAAVRHDDDVSIEQMMIALYQENPRAFYQENVNALLAGKTLKVPGREAILKWSRKQALAEFNRQTIAWKNRLSSAPTETNPVNETKLDNQLKLVAPVEATVSKNADIAPGNEQVEAANAGFDKSARAISNADEAIQSKIAVLEKQLAAMQQIIVLKDQQLAALQNQNGPVRDRPVQTEPAAQDNQQPQTAPVTQEPPIKPENVALEPSNKPEPVVKAQPVESPTPPAHPVQEKPIAPGPSIGEAVKPVIKSKPAIPSSQPSIQAEAENSSNFYYPALSGIVATTLTLLGWLWWRKRKVEEETNSESMFASSSMGKAFGVNKMAHDSTINNVINSASAESSFLSEFTANDFDTFDIDQGEIDPISEADVYLAYGRYQQAEELVRHAINDFPERNDCKLKLLEIFHVTENKKAFETYAAKLAESGKKDDLPFWAKVTDMAHQIIPDSNLFSAAAASFDPATNASPDAATVNLEKRDTPFKGAEKPDQLDYPAAEDSISPDFHQETDNVLDFDLTSFTAKEDIIEGDQKNNTSIDFDSNLLPVDNAAIKATEDDLSLAEDNIVNFNFNALADNNSHIADDLRNNESIEFNISSDVAETKINEMEFSPKEDYPGFDFSFDDVSGLNGRDNKKRESDDVKFNFALDMPLDDPTVQENDFGVSDLTDMDELETKLDLARAYIDMGDADSAKDIVNEVLEKGTAEQQKIAQTLMVDL